MDGKKLVSIDGSSLVDRLADDVDDAAERGGTDGNGDGAASVQAGLAADETFGTVHGNGSHDILAEMLSDLNQTKKEFHNLRSSGQCLL